MQTVVCVDMNNVLFAFQFGIDQLNDNTNSS